MGTVLAILFMLAFSNSKIDVPVTSDIQDFLTKVIKEKKSFSKSFAEVATERKAKVNKWLDNKKSKFDKFFGKASKIVNVVNEKPPQKKASGAK